MSTYSPGPYLVGAQTPPKSLASAITARIRSGQPELELHAVGAHAVNQAVKGLAIARGMLTPSGIEIAMIASFMDIPVENGVLAVTTGMRLTVIRR